MPPVHALKPDQPTNNGLVKKYAPKPEPSNIGGNAPLWPSVVAGVILIAVMLGILWGAGELLLWAFRS